MPEEAPQVSLYPSSFGFLPRLLRSCHSVVFLYLAACKNQTETCGTFGASYKWRINISRTNKPPSLPFTDMATFYNLFVTFKIFCSVATAINEQSGIKQRSMPSPQKYCGISKGERTRDIEDTLHFWLISFAFATTLSR